MNAAIKQIADVMRRANYAGALQYVPELSWILFLRILDEREEIEAEEAAALGIRFAPSLEAPFRWRDWAAPGGPKRVELTDAAKERLNRQLRTGASDQELAELAMRLREEGRLSRIESGGERREPQIICSLGLRSPARGT